ncbi:unnamed protein product [Camellia sinensis]
MAEDRESTSTAGGGQDDPVNDPEDPAKSPPNSPNSSTRKACYAVLQSWVSKKFMTGCVVLFPVAVTFLVTWWFIQFVDGFFSPIYERLGINIFGLGFVTSLVVVFFIGIFASSWVGGTVFWVGEWFIKRMPLVKHIYSASKQISAAISPGMFGLEVMALHWKKKLLAVDLTPQGLPPPKELWDLFWRHLESDQNTTAFKEVAIIRHPRIGEYAFGFITSSVVLQQNRESKERETRIWCEKETLLRWQGENPGNNGDEELCSVYVPTNHLYIGDIFLVNSREIIRPNLSIGEGIEIIVSVGMTMPQMIAPIERIPRQNDQIPLNRMM